MVVREGGKKMGREIETSKPYSDFQDPEGENQQSWIRHFSPEIEAEEMIWHRDREDRRIFILQAGGWFLQREDQLPQPIKEGEEIFIQAGEWHRAIGGEGELIIRITKFATAKQSP